MSGQHCENYDVKQEQFTVTREMLTAGFDFNFLQFPSVKFSDMLKTGRVWQEDTFKIEKSWGCQGSFFIFSIFVFLWLSENLVLQIFLIN